MAAVILAHSGLSVDLPPFTPITPQPDYGSIMVEKSHGRDIGSRRGITITHDSLWMQFSYASDESGASRQLSITRPDTISVSSALVTASPMKDLHRSERILGESCHWFDMLPGLASADHRSCLTSDGIVLKDVFSGREMSEQEWTAVRMTRRPIRLDEIKPPAELLDPQLWGLD